MADALAADTPADTSAPAGGGDDWGAGDAPAPTGAAYLSTLDPGRAAMVKAIGDGRLALPKATSRGGGINPQTQALIADVSQYNPAFDDVDAPKRVAAAKAWASGPQGQNSTSYNTTIGHLGTLASAAEDLNNFQSPLVNRPINSFESGILGDPRVTKFNTAKQAAIEELDRAFKGAAPDVTGTQQWESVLNAAQSPAQLRTAIQTAANLLGSRIQASQDAYNKAMGTTGQQLPMLNQHALEALQQLQNPDYINKGIPAAPPAGGAGAPAPTDPGAPPTPPAPGSPPSPAQPGTGGATITETARDEVGPQEKRVASALEAGINSGQFKTPEEAIAFAQAQGGDVSDPAFRKSIQAAYDYKAKGGTGYIDVATPVALPVQKTDTAGAAAAGFGNALTFGTLNKLGSAVDTGITKLQGDNRSLGDIYGSALARNNATLDQAEGDHPLATLAGNAAGFVTGEGALGAVPGVSKLAAAIPAAVRPIAGDALYGGLYGAGSSDNLSALGGNTVAGAALGAGGGMLGRGLVKGAAAVASPVANSAVRRLTDAGVTLTPGQILGANGGVIGSAVKGLEDRAAGFPIVGDLINNARRGGTEDFNRAAINDALKPIGETASDVGHAGIADAQQKVSDAYTAALSKMSATPDQTFTDDLRQVGQKVQSLSPAHRDQFNNIVDTDLQPYLNGKTQLDGSDLQAVKQGLDTRISNLRGQGSTPQDRDLADRLDDVKSAVLRLAGRTDPDAASDFNKADQAFAMLSRVNGAAAKSKDGVFTPNQFRQAVVKRGYGTTTKNVASGSALMQQLSTDASTVLPSTVPDSGTAGRALLAMAAAHGTGAALGGAEGYQQGGGVGALTGAALGGLAFSRPGLRATQALLAGSRGKTLNTLGDVLRANASLGGAVGTPLLLGQRNDR